MTPIRPHDLVRVRHRPEVGLVAEVDVECEGALVDFEAGDWVWLPLAVLELVPGQLERLVA